MWGGAVGRLASTGKRATDRLENPDEQLIVLEDSERQCGEKDAMGALSLSEIEARKRCYSNDRGLAGQAGVVGAVGSNGAAQVPRTWAALREG